MEYSLSKIYGEEVTGAGGAGRGTAHTPQMGITASAWP